MSEVHYFPEKLNAVVDSVVGGSNFFGLSEKGLLGQQIDLSASEAKVLSNTSIGTLYEGTYQYVKIASDAPNTGDEIIGIGRAVFWTDFDDFVVTTDSVVATDNTFAGILLNPDSTPAAAVATPGKYVWIQTKGRATVRCADTVTATTNNTLAIIEAATSNEINNIADATDQFSTVGGYKIVIGWFVTAPSNGGLAQVILNPTVGYDNYKR